MGSKAHSEKACLAHASHNRGDACSYKELERGDAPCLYKSLLTQAIAFSPEVAVHSYISHTSVHMATDLAVTR